MHEKDYQGSTSNIQGFRSYPFNGVINQLPNSTSTLHNIPNAKQVQNISHREVTNNPTGSRQQSLKPVSYGNHVLNAREQLKGKNLPNYCISCRTRAKIGNNFSQQQNDVDVHLNAVGVCDTDGCPGYMGHAPPPRLHRTSSPEMFDSAILSDGDTSDDVPLLISDIEKKNGENGSEISPNLSEEELTVVDHCHPSSSSQLTARREATKKAKRQLITACVLCSLFIAGEIVGGKISNSLAIMSDAAHMLSDLATFCISLFSIWMGERAAKKSFNYGFHRAEAVGAMFTIMIIWFVTGILFYLACSRLRSGTFIVEPDPMMVVAGCAVVFNIVLGILLHGLPHGHTHGSSGGGGSHSHGIGDMNHNHSHVGEPSSNKRRHLQQAEKRHLNVRAALIHVLGDLIQSVGVLISSIIIKIWPQAKMADPICTIMFSVIVMCTTIRVLRDVVRILMEGHPKGYSYDEIYNVLLGIKNVVRVHDLRVWSLTNDHVVLTVHLAVNPEEISETERILQVRKHDDIYNIH